MSHLAEAWLIGAGTGWPYLVRGPCGGNWRGNWRRGTEAELGAANPNPRAEASTKRPTMAAAATTSGKEGWQQKQEASVQKHIKQARKSSENAQAGYAQFEKVWAG